ncbi:hypothetical protein Pelo_3142 [Pelomyxa schiedti]|nr:hypothetical protein Pelo_3142 [Pelomyxa schiedti]
MYTHSHFRGINVSLVRHVSNKKLKQYIITNQNCQVPRTHHATTEMKGNNNKKASRCSLGVAETVPRKPTREIALECLALYADDKLRQCLSLARSLIADYDHADAHAFAHVLLAFINESEPRLLADDHSPETDEIEDVHHILATKCNLASQEWMINLLELTCADTGSSVKVKALCHYFLYMVLCGNYGNFPFTNEEKSRIHLRQAAEGRDPRALTRMYCFKNIKYAASLGYCPAQRGLASMYLKGVEKEKVPVNVPEAMRLLRIAAEKGDQWAQYWLGDMVSNENPAEAVRLLKLSLAQGNIAARISLGLKYITDAVSTNQFRNMAEASRLILSCEPKFGRWVQGGTCAYNPEMWSSAFNLLAAVYSSGSVGIERNTRVALRLYHNAFVALKDKPIAAKCEIVTNVAQLYANGTGGCPKDERESQRWWKLVLFSAQGPPAAIVSISANSVDFLFPRGIPSTKKGTTKTHHGKKK